MPKTPAASVEKQPEPTDPGEEPVPPSDANLGTSAVKTHLEPDNGDWDSTLEKEPIQVHDSLPPVDQATCTRVGGGSLSPAPDLAQETMARPPSVGALEGAKAPTPGALWVPGCEILSELARGGVGIVYKARQTRLNRIVALKILQPGGAMRPDARARFQIEGEAVARLHHPNIVQVFEVGEHDGMPYLLLEFLEGGTLYDRLRAKPMKPVEAVELVEGLARAIDSAHQHYIIHRDLKPSNVLLAADGTTKITDFGLAKFLNEETGQTKTGSIMGTPSYMAPEQAEGRVREIGPATDIYALGAILYEALAGRPPFQGATAMDTIHKVLSQDPVPPTRLRKTVPADLQTICLKCLEKVPAKRYPTALALAEDLRRFRVGEPIEARPATAWERTRKWALRHPAWTISAGVTAAALLALLVVSLLFNARLQTALVATREGWNRAEQEHREAEANRQKLAEQEANEQRRLAGVRVLAQAQLLKGQAALAQNDCLAAKLSLAGLLDQVSSEPTLVDLRQPAERLLAEANQQLARQAERQEAQARYQRFQQLRDDTLFYSTLVSGVDTAESLKATRRTAREALALFGIPEQAAPGPVALAAGFTDAEKADINEGCYELLLMLADAVAQPVPPQGAAESREQARQALALLDRAAQLVGSPTKAYYLRRARYLEQQGDQQAAKSERRLAEARAAKTAGDYFLVGDEAYKGGRLEEAVSAFESALRVQPGHFWAEYFLAVCQLMRQRPGEAQLLLTSCLSQRDGFVWIYLVRGVADGELRQFTAAEEDFRKALDLQPDVPARYGILVNRGAMRLQQGQVENAVADFEAAIRLLPRQYQAHVNLAQAYQRQKQMTKALAQLDEAVRLAPTMANPYRLRARLHRECQELDEALEDLTKAMEHEPADSPLLADDHLERGAILHQQKKYGAALAAYDAALQIRPDLARAYRLRADALLALNRGRDALAAFDHYLGPDDHDAEAYRLRGFERAKLGNQPGAIADYTRALEIEPQSAVTRARRGWALLESRDAIRQALRDFEEALRLEPENGELYNGRGYARVLLGQYRDGIADAEEALKRGPQAEELRQRLALKYNAACVFAQAAGQAAADTAASDAAALADRYQARAVVLLRQALDLLPPKSRAAYVQQAVDEPAFAPVRKSAAFEKLVKEYSRPAD
jgi:tetratricopeptide (TPR) repeat protein